MAQAQDEENKILANTGDDQTQATVDVTNLVLDNQEKPVDNGNLDGEKKLVHADLDLEGDVDFNNTANNQKKPDDDGSDDEKAEIEDEDEDDENENENDESETDENENENDESETDENENENDESETDDDDDDDDDDSKEGNKSFEEVAKAARKGLYWALSGLDSAAGLLLSFVYILLVETPFRALSAVRWTRDAFFDAISDASKARATWRSERAKATESAKQSKDEKSELLNQSGSDEEEEEEGDNDNVELKSLKKKNPRKIQSDSGEDESDDKIEIFEVGAANKAFWSFAWNSLAAAGILIASPVLAAGKFFVEMATSMFNGTYEGLLYGLSSTMQKTAGLRNLGIWFGHENGEDDDHAQLISQKRSEGFWPTSTWDERATQDLDNSDADGIKEKKGNVVNLLKGTANAYLKERLEVSNRALDPNMTRTDRKGKVIEIDTPSNRTKWLVNSVGNAQTQFSWGWDTVLLIALIAAVTFIVVGALVFFGVINPVSLLLGLGFVKTALAFLAPYAVHVAQFLHITGISLNVATLTGAASAAAYAGIATALVTAASVTYLAVATVASRLFNQAGTFFMKLRWWIDPANNDYTFADVKAHLSEFFLEDNFVAKVVTLLWSGSKAADDYRGDFQATDSAEPHWHGVRHINWWFNGFKGVLNTLKPSWISARLESARGKSDNDLNSAQVRSNNNGISSDNDNSQSSTGLMNSQLGDGEPDIIDASTETGCSEVLVDGLDTLSAATKGEGEGWAQVIRGAVSYGWNALPSFPKFGLGGKSAQKPYTGINDNDDQRRGVTTNSAQQGTVN